MGDPRKETERWQWNQDAALWSALSRWPPPPPEPEETPPEPGYCDICDTTKPYCTCTKETT